MNNANIKTMIFEEQWSLLYQFLKKEIHLAEDASAKKELIEIFEAIDENYRNLNMMDLYNIFWKWALEFGKIRIAKSYLLTLIDHLIKYKRIPELRRIKSEAESILSREQIKSFNAIDIIIGKKLVEDESQFHQVRLHPEQWKSSKQSLKNYLLIDAHWDLSSWKLIYEFFLRYQYDKEIVVMLAERNRDMRTQKSEEWNEKFQELYRLKKINTKSLQWHSKTKGPTDKYSQADLDNMALSLLSGELKDESVNQDLLIASIKAMNHEELVLNGKEMIVAFSFLGMEKVVIYLCEELMKISDEIKQKIALLYSIAQSLYTCGQYYKSIDVATDALLKEALLRDEKVAFKYLMAECYFNLKNNQRAQELYLEVKRMNPHFRLVRERLSTIE